MATGARKRSWPGVRCMPEELRLVPRSATVPSPTLRDVAAVFFRQQRLWTLSFVVVLVGVVSYGVFAPAYRAEMKVLVRRGRTNASATPTLRQAPQFDGKGVSEEDLNSEVELLRERDVLAQVVRTAGLAAGTSWSPIGGDDDAARIDRAVDRLQ